jgi:hypothetical protein
METIPQAASGVEMIAHYNGFYCGSNRTGSVPALTLYQKGRRNRRVLRTKDLA